MGHLSRLLHFAEPRPDDVCLDIAWGRSTLAPALASSVRSLTSADPDAVPSGRFTLVTARPALARETDPAGRVRDLLDVCQGRLVIAEPVRTRVGDGIDRIERLRHPDHTATPTPAQLVELVAAGGGRVRRLDVFTIERPAETWLADAGDPDLIRRELMAELDGGPKTGVRPRVIGSELWFAQSWAYIAAEPVRRRWRRRAAVRRRR